ncbi:dihydrodipicolinate synthase family protein [Agrobacterium sp. T29]|uniref:dihydrodipicolinate synthase family protein n=1 Tax=Agrobacterium sp. T29 TaxID=2580515 RepID=UPI00143D91C9|nr:dihydrodipicolinate synthase family protein [Agrobacterium sp. T29]
MSKKRSVVVVSITTFDDRGRLDEEAYRKHLGRLRDARCSVYVSSISSEVYSMSKEEIDRVLAISREELEGRVPYRAMGFEPRNAQELISFMQQVEKAGVGAAQIFSLDLGHGVKPNEAELEIYYSTIIESSPLKFWLSSHPKSMGYELPLSLVERLCNKYSQIQGIAYGGVDLSYYAELIHRLGDRLEIHNAGPALALNSLGLGANGFMGSEGNFAPQLVQSVIDAWEANDYPALAAAYGKLMRLTGIILRSGGVGMRSVKPLMNAFGFPAGMLRAPRLPIGNNDLDRRIDDIVALDIPGIPAPISPRPYAHV